MRWEKAREARGGSPEGRRGWEEHDKSLLMQ
jgi:hypothetical protein